MSNATCAADISNDDFSLAVKLHLLPLPQVVFDGVFCCADVPWPPNSPTTGLPRTTRSHPHLAAGETSVPDTGGLLYCGGVFWRGAAVFVVGLFRVVGGPAAAALDGGRPRSHSTGADPSVSRRRSSQSRQVASYSHRLLQSSHSLFD